jgi:exonuclease III
LSLKTLALCKTNADIIFLSDIRLNSNTQTAAINSLTKQLNFNGYDFHFNSKYASRGVGLLIKRSLALTVVSKQEDRIGNILMLKLSGAGTNDGFLNLFSVYGPNNNDGEFYADLTNFLTNCGSDNIIQYVAVTLTAHGILVQPNLTLMF